MTAVEQGGTLAGTAKPVVHWGPKARPVERAVLAVFVGTPFLALALSMVIIGSRGIGWADAAIALVMYALTGMGISVGYHRLFTHRAFKAPRHVRVALAMLGTMAIEGDVITWVSDHRRHHQYSDVDGDPHSPWRFGFSPRAVAKGMFWAHFGWMFENERTHQSHFAPDLLDDKDILTVVRMQPLLVFLSFGTPAAVGAMVTQSWAGALSAFFWAGLVRVGVLHHVTWSINSICHAFGSRSFRSRDRSGNVWWLAVPSFGEAWHNYHHADPTSARHGVLRGQLDISARAIWLLERCGWAQEVHWPSSERIAERLRATAS